MEIIQKCAGQSSLAIQTLERTVERLENASDLLNKMTE
jgi:hypothetical protein